MNKLDTLTISKLCLTFFALIVITIINPINIIIVVAGMLIGGGLSDIIKIKR